MWLLKTATRSWPGAFLAGLIFFLAADPSVCSVVEDIIDQAANEAAAPAAEEQVAAVQAGGPPTPAGPTDANAAGSERSSSLTNPRVLGRPCARGMAESLADLRLPQALGFSLL